MIKLLPKNKIAENKAKQASREIQEGVKVATRIDGLRELWSKTENDFELYKTSTLARINEEIVTLKNKKDKLSGELKDMQSRYDSLMPDIATKRTELAKFEKGLVAWESKLEKREESASLAEIDVAEALEKAENARIRNEDNERISANLVIQSQEKRVQAQNILDTAKNLRDTVENEKKDIEAGLALREYGIKTKEQELSNKELILINERKELESEQILLKDRQETLQRTLNRMKQNRLP